MNFRFPVQDRAKASTEKFLDSFSLLLAAKGYNLVSIQEIADVAGLTKPAFLARFKTKRNALLLLFERYCSNVSQEMAAITKTIQDERDAGYCAVKISKAFESHLMAHFASNRAMHELFLEDLKVDERTQKIFRELVDLMQLVQRHHLSDHDFTDTGAFSAAQMLVTTNYNYVLKAMPALPRDADVRHRMIATMVVEALKF